VLQGVASSTLYWPADEVGSQTPGRLRPRDLSLHYTSCHIPSICFRRNPPRSLSCKPDPEVIADQVVWGIFWKVFRRSCGLPIRSVGPTDRSAGLLVGRTHLSGTVVSLVSGDPGVPMSHNLLAKFIITCTLKDKLTTWLCLVEGYLTNLHDLVSFKIKHTM
jgi:hypothetical protein